MSVLNGPSAADMEVWCEKTIDDAPVGLSVKTAAAHLLSVYRERGEEVRRLRAELATKTERVKWFENAGGVAMATRIFTVMAERDRLRELLLDAKLCLQDRGEYTQRMMIASIDAALRGEEKK